MSELNPGDMSTFNMQHGYSEALVRGYKSGFLKDQDYHHLCQCETLDDVKLNLQETDYGNFLADESSPFLPNAVQKRAMQKLADQWNFMRAQATQPLAQFMDFTTYEFMIDNIILIIKYSLNGQTISAAELEKECNPLGKIPTHIINAISAFDNSPKGYSDLFHIILVELPVGKYFCAYLNEQSRKGVLYGAPQVKSLLQEGSLTLLQQGVMRLYLEDFYRWTQTLGGYTAEMMGEILKTKADTLAIHLILSSFNTAYNEPQMRPIRKALLPAFGFLYPEGLEALSEVTDVESLGRVLDKYWVYRRIFDVAIQNEQMSVDDAFYLNEVRLLESAFDSQFHFACFYGYCHLKLQEIRNLVWICECIVQKQRAKIDKYIPIFNPNAPWRQGKLGI